MENEEIEKMENEEATEMEVVSTSNVKTFAEFNQRSGSKCDIITNITDKKKIFNLEQNVDSLLNDCEGEKIRVKEVLIKRYEKEMKNPIIDEETGEIIKDKEINMSCILIDDNGKSYATGSKMFTMQLIKAINMYGEEELKNGIEIEIIKKKFKDTNNKVLSFILL